MQADAATVLIVDDQPLNIDLLEQELAAAGYRTVAARGGEAAIALARERAPELILLDVMMPGIDGYETCRRLKTDAATRSIPVIFLTALKETFEKVRAFELGAVDYVTKPFESEELLARVGAHVALRREIEAHRRSKATIRALVEQSRGDADGALVGDSPALARVRELIGRVAGSDSTVLVTGETGTGKELVARALHAQGARRERPLVKLNCAALPRELVESELFGHEKGAFTGALAQRRGRFELADGGSLLLDEVGELPLAAQAKLLRVLQEREFERVGGTHALRVDVRVIAATNRDLRELENVVERALIMSPGGLLDVDGGLTALPAFQTELTDPGRARASLLEVERAHIRRALEAAHWTIEGEAGAARGLGLNPSTLRGRMRKLGIRKGA